MNTDALYFTLGVTGGIFGILFTIIGFFIRQLVSDIRRSVEENGKNKGRIELVEQQLNSDLKRIEQMTQLELRVMSENISELSASVKTLVDIQIKKNA